VLALLLAATLAWCDCPHSNPVFRTESNLLVCGVKEEGHEVSELDLLNCNNGETVLQFTATHKVTVQQIDGNRLLVIDHSDWPFGEHWKQIYVPVAEYIVDPDQSGPPKPKPIIPKPAATPAEMQQFISEYLALLAKAGRPSVDDTIVGKLYACVIAGDQRARGLFEVMPRDTELDGASAEAWEYANNELALIPPCECANVVARTSTFLVACSIRGELEIRNCRSGLTVLSFDGTQDATVEQRGDTLHVIESRRWPFGPHWQWIHMPLFEWTIDQQTPANPHPRRLLPRPAATAAEIRAQIAAYRAWLKKPIDERKDYEQFVGRMFAAAVSGDREARALFETMDRDAHLDGEPGEVWNQANAELELLR
jgi:hypothetical protein